MARAARTLVFAAALVALLAAAPAGLGAVIGFDDLPAGTRVAEQYASQGVHFGTSPFAGIGGGFVATASTRGGSAPNAAALDHDAGTDFSSSWIRFDRQQARVALRACRVGPADPATNVNVRALDSNGTEVANLQGIPCDPTGPLVPVTVTAPHITYVAVEGNGAGWQLDDLDYETDPAPQAPPVLPPTPPPPPPKDYVVHYETPLLPRTIVLRPGERITRRIVVDRSESSFGPIRFSLDGLVPAGLAVNFTPSVVSGTGRGVTTMSVSAEPDMAPAFLPRGTIRATPQGTTAGSVVRTIPVEILVQGQLAVHTEGIEVTQAVQTYGQPTRDPYEGVALVKRKTTVVRVFAGYSGTVPPAYAGYPRRPALGMELNGFDANRRPLPGSPLQPVWSPPSDTLSVNDSGLSSAERNASGSAFVFVLPSSWTEGALSLTARALAPAPSSGVALRLRPEPPAAAVCVSFRCGGDPIRSLGGITFRDPPPAKVISALSVLYVNDGTTSGIPLVDPVSGVARPITGVPVEPARALEKLVAISPVPLLFLGPGGGTSPVPVYRAVRFASPGAILEAAQAYDQDSGSQGDYVLGLFAWPPGAGYAPGPRTGVADASLLAGSGGNPDRPLTTVAHETLHLLGRGHADSICGGRGGGFPTPEGRMSSVGLDTTWGSGGAAPGSPPFRVIPDELFHRRYDLMSYCGQLGGGDPDHWISARTWNALLGVTPAAGTERVRRAQATAPSLTVRAQAAASGVRIVMLDPSTGPAPPAGAPSEFTLVARDAAGAVLASAPMTASDATPDTAGAPAVRGLAAAVPPAGVARVEIVAGGAVVASRDASAAPPLARIISPRPGARVGAGRPLRVRWAASDPDGGALGAALEYSPDAGRTWTQVAGGPDLGGVTLPARLLRPSDRGRLRLRVDDGFRTVVTAPQAIVVTAGGPVLTILGPVPGQRVQAGARVNLRGIGIDARGRRIAAGRLRWSAGGAPLGRGEDLSVTLPAGARSVALQVARTGGRAVDRVSVPVRVRATTPFFLRLAAPARIARGASAVAVTVAATQDATLRVGGFRASVGPRARRLSVPVRPGASRLTLRFVLTAGGLRGEQFVVIRR